MEIRPTFDRAAVVTDTGTARTLSQADADTYLQCNNESAITVTVPPQEDVKWAPNTQLEIEQSGAGQVTFAEGDGVTVNSSQTLKTAAQYSVVKLKRVAEDLWTLSGEREASEASE